MLARSFPLKSARVSLPHNQRATKNRRPTAFSACLVVGLCYNGATKDGGCAKHTQRRNSRLVILVLPYGARKQPASRFAVGVGCRLAPPSEV